MEITIWVGSTICAIIGTLLGILYYQLQARVEAFEQKFVTRELFETHMKMQDRTLARIETALERKVSKPSPWPKRPGEE